MNHNFTSICEYADRLPPFVCRLLARKSRQQPLTTKEIAERSGLDEKTVIKLSKQKSWAKYLRIVDSFRAACGVNPRSERKQFEYVRLQRANKNPFPHLNALSWQERKMLMRIVKQQ